MKTNYGLKFNLLSKVKPSWSDYDKQIARTHLANAGKIIVDTTYGNPIDNEYDLDEIYQILSRTQTVKKLGEGEFFRLKDSETAPVWVRGGYLPACRKFSCHKFDDINHERLMNGDTSVFVGFTF